MIMSRAFNIAAVDTEPVKGKSKSTIAGEPSPSSSMQSLTSSMSSLDADIINEVFL